MKKILGWVFVFLTVAWMALIFCMSSADSGKSSGMSRSVDRTVARVIHSDFDKWESDRQDAFIMKIDHPVRKIAHFSEYTVLGVLLFTTCSLWGAGAGRSFLLSFPAGVAYAATDEIHQSFVSGRAGRFTDVLIDGGGVLFGCAAAILVALTAASVRRKRAK
ncbi:MAG: VanZ family protein [Clostridia bacterium]|nr:VanZ family protein [Clostridia bacterium]